MIKKKLIIEPHFRLQEWVAEEKGYFKDEGLDYVFQELIQSSDGAHHYKGDKVGAMQSFERGRTSDVSCACHWTVGVAASKGKGRLYAGVYSVAPAGVFVPPDSPVRTPTTCPSPRSPSGTPRWCAGGNSPGWRAASSHGAPGYRWRRHR